MWKTLGWGALIGIGCGIALLPGLLIYWFNESPPISYSYRRVLTPEVPPGGDLRIKVSAEVKKPCIATVTRSIVDATGTVYLKEPITRPAFTDYTVEFKIPLGASPGIAQYRAKIEWHCNIVQDYFPMIVLQPELEFMILPLQDQEQVPKQQGIYLDPTRSMLENIFGLSYFAFN
jgi:hypothetical protein